MSFLGLMNTPDIQFLLKGNHEKCSSSPTKTVSQLAVLCICMQFYIVAFWWCPCVSLIIWFAAGPSAAPRFIRFFIESSLQVTISWELPLADDRNGIITSYELNCIVTNSAERTSIEETLHVVAPRFDSPSEQSYQLNAKHQSTYMCSVSAATVNGSGPASNRSSVTVELPKLDISHNGDDSVIASWEVPHVVAEGLVQNNVSLIYNELGTGGEKFIISVPVASTKWTINNLGEATKNANVSFMYVVDLYVVVEFGTFKVGYACSFL